MARSLLIIVSLLLVGCQSRLQVTQSRDSFLNHEWKLIAAASSLTFLSTKNKTHTEEHKLQFSKGRIDSNNSFVVIIDLNTVDTLIPIRDERMRKILFNTEKYPSAHVTTLIPNDLELDQMTELSFKLDLHGFSQTMNAKLMPQMVDGQLVVINYEPIAINTKNFGMDDGINQLTKIAGLQSIDYTALVDFKLTFEK